MNTEPTRSGRYHPALWLLPAVFALCGVVEMVASRVPSADHPRMVERCIRSHAEYMPIFTWVCDERVTAPE